LQGIAERLEDPMNEPTIRHAIVAGHPSPDSFTLAMAKRYAKAVGQEGHEVVLRDLYRIGFDPVLKEPERHGAPAPDVDTEWQCLGRPDVFVLVYPIWFGSPPAMLKGYVERVLGAGRSRGFETLGTQDDPLAGKYMVSLTCSGQKRPWLEEHGVPESLRTIYDRYLADRLGVAETHRYHFDGISDSTPASEIRAHLDAVERAARAVVTRLAKGPPDIDPYRYLRQGTEPS
jgi:NAD(P)H dehydrogenase (quinone)